VETKKPEPKEGEEPLDDPLENLKPINKMLCSIITDDNIVLHDG